MTATEWLTPREAAGQLRTNVETIYDGCAHERIPHRRIGRTLRIPRWWVDGVDLQEHNGAMTPAAPPGGNGAARESQSNGDAQRPRNHRPGGTDLDLADHANEPEGRRHATG
jgi:excisionase family DNA binding protein